MLAGWLSGTRYRWHQVLVVLEMVMPHLLCLFMVVMVGANMVVWVVLAVVRADIVIVNCPTRQSLMLFIGSLH